MAGTRGEPTRLERLGGGDRLAPQDDYLTFHLGDDTSWSRPELLEYAEHNTAEAIDALEEPHARGLTSTIQQHCWDDFYEVFKLGFNRMRFVTATAREPRCWQDRQVLIHAIFRTGSTFMWHRMRGSRHLHAFYEPLHEVLARLRPDTLDQFRRQHTLGTRHDFKGAWLFKEYEELLEQGMSGLPGYWETFAYEGFADNSPQPALRGYIDRLLGCAGGRPAVLQFHRSALRQRWSTVNTHRHTTSIWFAIHANSGPRTSRSCETVPADSTATMHSSPV